jgi:hypothetical protein
LFAAKNSYDYYDPDVLGRIVRLLHDTGLQISFHIVGDKGIDQALAAIEAAMKANKRRDPRHRIEHGLFVNPDSLKRIKKLKSSGINPAPIYFMVGRWLQRGDRRPFYGRFHADRDNAQQ